MEVRYEGMEKEMVGWVREGGMALQALAASLVWKVLRSMLQVTPLSDWRAERTADRAVRARAAVSRAERRRAIVGFWGGW